MKADKWGTPSENIRFAAHWLPATSAKLAGKNVRTGPFCEHLGLATRQGAWCNHWRERQA